MPLAHTVYESKNKISPCEETVLFPRVEKAKSLCELGVR